MVAFLGGGFYYVVVDRGIVVIAVGLLGVIVSGILFLSLGSNIGMEKI